MEDVYYSTLVPKDWLISLPRTLDITESSMDQMEPVQASVSAP